MVEPLNYVQQMLARVVGFGSGKKAKTLIVACGDALKRSVQYVAYLKFHDAVEIIDVTGADMSGKSALTVEPQFHAVVIAADNPAMMIKLGRLCANYRDTGVPVVVLMGWPPPMDGRQFHREVATAGNLTIPGMFDVAAAYLRGGKGGDVLEFGTFQGHSLQCAYHAFDGRGHAKDRRFIAFDSFAGIVGQKTGEGFFDGAYATSETSLRFANFLAEVPDDRVVVVSGPYAETLGVNAATTRRRLEPLTAALVHVDCDVEAPAKLALDFVTPYLRQGSLLLFDEYDLHQASNAVGERAALRAWLKENPRFDVELFRTYGSAARAFIVHKQS